MNSLFFGQLSDLFVSPSPFLGPNQRGVGWDEIINWTFYRTQPPSLDYE